MLEMVGIGANAQRLVRKTCRLLAVRRPFVPEVPIPIISLIPTISFPFLALGYRDTPPDFVPQNPYIRAGKMGSCGGLG